MSKIALSGDPSGSGTFTIASPNSNSNYTLTLPTSTGTMALLQTPSFATTIGVGGATPAASGAGITFPATQSASSDANTLDDYEEGTWTPTYTLSSGSFTTLTYATQSGFYVKVGRMVWCYWDLATASVNYGANGSSQVYISGLPFTPQSTAGAGIINQANNWASNNPNSVICSAGTAVLYPGNNNWIQNAATIASYMNTATATRNEAHGCIVYITST